MSATQIILDSLRDAKVRWLALFAVLGLTAGAGLLTAGSALAGVSTQPRSFAASAAGVGSEPGNLVLDPSSGALTLNPAPTWSTTDGCPSGHQDSANVTEFNPDGTLASLISVTVNSGLTAPFGATLDGNVGALLRVAGISAASPGTVEWAVGCWNGPGGTGTGATPVVYTQSTFVSVAAGATTYTTSSSAPSGGTPTGAPTSTPTSTPTATPTDTSTGTPTPTPTDTSTGSPTPTPTDTSTGTPTPTPTDTSTTAAPIPTATSSVLPVGAPQTGAGGASLSGNDSNALIALGIALLAGSAAATGLAVRRARALPGGDGPAHTQRDGS